MSGASLSDWLWIARFPELEKRVYLFDPETKSACHPKSCPDRRFQPTLSKESSLPWPIVWTTARFHKKHIHTTGVAPKPVLVANGLLQLERRVRWHWHFSVGPGRGLSSGPGEFSFPSASVAQYRGAPNPPP